MNNHFKAFFGLLTLLVAGSAFFAPVHAAPKGKPTVGTSGYPLPRFAALKANEVNMRTGPGTQYPISWVYHRKALPMEIIDEFGPWRKVRDHENTTGWILRQLLLAPRSAMIRGKTRTLYQKKSLTSAPSIIAEPGVIGRLLACDGIWCRLNIKGRKGWIERRHLWGVYKNEVIK